MNFRTSSRVLFVCCIVAYATAAFAQVVATPQTVVVSDASPLPKSDGPSSTPTLLPLWEKDGTSSKFLSAFLASISMILVSEFGDKTFFIAAIMAMRHNRLQVFASAIAALALMTVLSAVMGFTLPNILPPRLTHAMATLLFFIFGIKLLKDAYGMDPSADLKEELEEVEEELEKTDDAGTGQLELGDVGGDSSAKSRASKTSLFLRRFLSPVFIQCFTMTFLAEWGDRSQIATIALAAQKDAVGITLGGIVGHSICTGVAVLAGKMLATRISERTISITGGILFLLFAVHSIVFPEH